MTAIILFCLLSLFLVVGKLLRANIPLLQRLYLPSSVIGGLVGLILLQCFPNLLPADVTKYMTKLPGFLINIVFASLFLGMVTPSVKSIIKTAFPQLCFSQILAWGQYVLGLGLAGFILTPLFGINPAFGNLLEIGFEGGHGTVGGMASTFEANNWSEGIALGYTMATVGMILAIVVGMILVNWANHKGYVSQVVPFSRQDKLRRKGFYKQGEMPSAGRQTVLCDSLDSLAWHIALIGLSVALGYIALTFFQQMEIKMFPDAAKRVFAGFPLFPFCMIGGLIIQKAGQACKINSLIDHGQMQRIAGAALDFLVVAAMATIKLKVVMANWQALLILIVAGTVFAVAMVIFAAPKLFKESWFECAIADFGQATGVTATGLLLLRAVDPESKTCAAQAFGYKQLLHEPVMGGGLWTALALTLLYKLGWQTMLIISASALVIWVIIAVSHCKLRDRK